MIMVIQQPRTQWSKGGVRVDWKWGPYIPTGQCQLDVTPTYATHGCHVSMGDKQLTTHFLATIQVIVREISFAHAIDC